MEGERNRQVEGETEAGREEANYGYECHLYVPRN